MKKYLLLTLLSGFLMNANATNLYWVGDSTGLSSGGLCTDSRWHNPNCWSFTSGGTIHPLTPPTSGDDVYFDSNWTHNIVWIGNDTIAECNNLFFSDGPVQLADGQIYLSGDLIISSTDPNSYGLFQPVLHFINPVVAHLSIPNDFMANAYYIYGEIQIENGCELILDTDYYKRGFSFISVDDGKFNLNGHRFRAATFGGLTGSVMDVSNSALYCAGIYNDLKITATANANLYMDIIGFSDNAMVINTAGGTLNFDTISINKVPMTIGWEGLYCDDCYINNLLIDSSRLAGFAVNGHIQNVSVTASELTGGVGYPYNLTVDVFNFEPYGFPYPYGGSGRHLFYFGSNTTTILDTFKVSNGTGALIELSSYDGFTALNVNLGDEYCFDSLGVIGFNNVGLPLHVGINGSDLGGNTNVLFDSCGYINYLVWPGDANADSIVTALDMLSVGLYFGSTGPARDSVSNLWIGHNASDWTGTQYNGANYKQADCNGDGVIDFIDTVAVNLNYGLTRLALTSSTDRSGEPIFIVPDAGVYAPGSLVTLEVWAGNAADPLNNIYGLNYEVAINPAAVEPGTLNINYSGSWMGIKNTDMITMQRYNSGVINITQVRNDQINVSGFGKIAEIKFIANNAIGTITNFPITVNTLDAIDNTATPLLVMGLDTTIAVDPSLEVSDLNNAIRTIIYPNPSNGIIYVQSNQPISKVDIIDVSGKLVSTISGLNAYKTTVDLSAASPGIYSLRISSSIGVTIHKISVTK